MADPDGLKVDTSLSLTASCLGEENPDRDVSAEGIEQELSSIHSDSDSQETEEDDTNNISHDINNNDGVEQTWNEKAEQSDTEEDTILEVSHTSTQSASSSSNNGDDDEGVASSVVNTSSSSSGSVDEPVPSRLVGASSNSNSTSHSSSDSGDSFGTASNESTDSPEPTFAVSEPQGPDLELEVRESVADVPNEAEWEESPPAESEQEEPTEPEGIDHDPATKVEPEVAAARVAEKEPSSRGTSEEDAGIEVISEKAGIAPREETECPVETMDESANVTAEADNYEVQLEGINKSDIKDEVDSNEAQLEALNESDIKDEVDINEVKDETATESDIKDEMDNYEVQLEAVNESDIKDEVDSNEAQLEGINESDIKGEVDSNEVQLEAVNEGDIKDEVDIKEVKDELATESDIKDEVDNYEVQLEALNESDIKDEVDSNEAQLEAVQLEAVNESNIKFEVDSNEVKDETATESDIKDEVVNEVKDQAATESDSKDEENTHQDTDGAQMTEATTTLEDSNSGVEQFLQEPPEKATTENPQAAEEFVEKDPAPTVVRAKETTQLSKNTSCDGALEEESDLPSDLAMEEASLENNEGNEKEPSDVSSIQEAEVKAEDADVVATEEKDGKEDTPTEVPLPQPANEVASSGIDDTNTALPQAKTPASQSAQDRVRRYATFKPIVPEECDHNDTKSLVTARDLPHLEHLSVDTSNDHSADANREMNLEESNDDAQEMEASMTPRAPNPAVPLTDATCTDSDSFSSSSGDSYSFQAQQEPDGDCEFLDQTLNLSAIDTSMQQSTASTTVDLPPLVMSGIVEQHHDPILLNHHEEEDAPGDIMTNESKVTSDHSLVLLKIPEAGEKGKAFASEIASARRPDTQLADCDLVAQSDFIDANRVFEEPEANISVESITSYISAEQSWEGIELIRAQSTSPQRNPSGPLPLDDCAVELSMDECNTELTLSKSTVGMNQQPLADDPLLARFSTDQSPGASMLPPTTSNINERSGKLKDDDTPIARMRFAPADPEGTVIDKQPDPTLLGGLKKDSFSDERPRPRVSFAAMHKGPHYDRLADSTAPPLLVNDDILEVEASEVRPSFSVEEARRKRFAAYLKRRMIDYEESEEDEEEEECFVPIQHDTCRLPRCQEGIPRVLDPTMCASVESSFTTLVSKADTVEDGSTIFSALEKLMKSSKSKYNEDSGSDSSSCSDSEYTFEDDDGRSTSIFPSFFTEADTTRDSNNGTLDPIPKWCDNIVLPSVYQLEDFLAEFLTDNKKQVTQGPQHSEQEALSDFVDELENEEPLAGDDEREPVPREEEPTLSVSAVSKSKSNTTSQISGQQDADVETFYSHETQQDCGVLTLEDVHELALMAAAAIDASTKTTKRKQPLSLKTRKSGLNDSSDSTEAAWDRVEHTVNDLESVTGHSVNTKSKRHSRITAKLEHIKKTQPHVYKVFLAKMAAAERSGRKIDLRRDDVVLRAPPVKGKDSASPRKAASIGRSPGEAVSFGRNTSQSLSNDISVQTPNGSVKIHVESGSSKNKISSAGLSEWETFDGSPFKEPSTQATLAADFMVGANDDSSVLDDFKWLSSAKDSFTSTMESFIGTQKEIAKPLKEKLAQYSKTHPNFYRIIMKKVSEREGPTSTSQVRQYDSGKPDGVNAASFSADMKGGDSKINIVGNGSNEVVKLKATGDDSILTVGNPMELTEDEFGPQQDKNNTVSPTKLILEGPGDVSTGTATFPRIPPSPKTTRPLKSQSVKLSKNEDHFSVESSKANVARSRACLVAEQVPALHQINERDSRLGCSLRRRGSTTKSRDGSSALSGSQGIIDAEEDPKIVFAKKIEFFAKSKSDPVQPQVSALVAQTSSVASKVSMFSKAKDKDRSQMAPSKTPAKDPQLSQSALHRRTDKELHTRVSESLQPKQECIAPRSKTPLSSNRSGTGSQGKSSKYELTRTTRSRSSNRSQTKLLIPEVLQNAPSLNSSVSKEENIALAKVKSATVAKIDMPEEHSRAEAKVPSPNTPPSSQWETFEESTFNGFVMQSLGRRTVPEDGPETNSCKTSTNKNEAAFSNRQDSLPQIDLQATFLDSILPAPPSFHDKAEVHQQQRDPWDFSEAAGEQWEHFSPTSFPTNFTNWGLKERPTPAPKTSGRKPHSRSKARSSPSSIAEF